MYMYDSLVRRHPTLAGAGQYRLVNTQVKGTRVNAWVYLPGPPQLRRTQAVPALGVRIVTEPARRLTIWSRAGEDGGLSGLS
jgi:hypothetical protein